MEKAGFKVDVQATDWNTIVSRRTSQKPIKEGGWNMFFTNWNGADLLQPDRQLRDRRQGHERRLVRLGRRRQDRICSRTISCARLRPRTRRRSRPKSRRKPGIR